MAVRGGQLIVHIIQTGICLLHIIMRIVCQPNVFLFDHVPVNPVHMHHHTGHADRKVLSPPSAYVSVPVPVTRIFTHPRESYRSTHLEHNGQKPFLHCPRLLLALDRNVIPIFFFSIFMYVPEYTVSLKHIYGGYIHTNVHKNGY